jgi:hypothetical protein
MNIKQSVLRNELKQQLYREFLKDSKDQLVSVYKQRVDLSSSAREWGGCWSGLDENITYKDIEGLLEDES